MLKVFEEFRNRLDEVMLKAFGRRIVLWGYGYTGRFLAWYAEYYHGLTVDYIIEDNLPASIPYEFPIFRSSLFDFDYKDVKNAVVWLAVCEEKIILDKLSKAGFLKGKNYYNFLELIYGSEYINPVIEFQEEAKQIFWKKKTGNRDVQFMEWLEYKYDCNLVTAIDSSNLSAEGAHPYKISTQKEIFPILDRCHCMPQENDAIFDFGCGKGGAMIAFLDYGFKKVGGVEFEKEIYDIMMSNFENLGIKSLQSAEMSREYEITCIHGDARECREILDCYNWFYYFDPFERDVFVQTVKNIGDSLKRNPRRIHIININPAFHDEITTSGFFVLTNQFCVSVRQRVVDIFVTKKEYEGYKSYYDRSM